MPVQWNKFRTFSGSDEINLVLAYKDRYGDPSAKQEFILLEIMSLQPINSRQVAAIAIATVYSMKKGTPDGS